VSSNLKFVYFGVVSTGSTNDNISYLFCVELKAEIDSLPLGMYGIADVAYTLSEKLLIPFIGVDRLDPTKDAFNYYLSQLRIHVQMAFARLVNIFHNLSGKSKGEWIGCPQFCWYVLDSSISLHKKIDHLVDQLSLSKKRWRSLVLLHSRMLHLL
jgi:hypothetical protein